MNEIILLTITTSLGSFDIELYQKEAPITANNFVEYVEQNFYENTLFHRVIPGFVIQGGGFEIGMSPKETNPPIKNEADNGLKNDKYTLSMARTQDLDSATSQFFINLVDNKSLDYPSMGGYAVFGKVISGEEVIDEIASVTDPTYGTENQPGGGWGSDLTPFVKRNLIPFRLLDPVDSTWRWCIGFSTVVRTADHTAISQCWDAGIHLSLIHI